MYTLIVFTSVFVIVGCMGMMPMLDNTPEAEQFLQSIYDKDEPIPKEVDWRKVPGRVSGVKDNVICGAPWAFSVTGVLEGQQKVRLNNTGDLIPLSEQNLVDCINPGRGCTEGQNWMMTNAFDYIKMNGIMDEKSYPYKSEEGKCIFDRNKSIMSDRGYAILPKGDEAKLKEVVAKYGPVAAGVSDRPKFVWWKSTDVFTDPTCYKDIGNLGMTVLIVGYGTDPQQGDYWIIKNCWGEKWANDGYMKLARNQNNMCGIATFAVIATF